MKRVQVKKKKKKKGKVRILYHSLKVLVLKCNSDLHKKKEIRNINQNLHWPLQVCSPAQFLEIARNGQCTVQTGMAEREMTL